MKQTCGGGEDGKRLSEYAANWFTPPASLKEAFSHEMSIAIVGYDPEPAGFAIVSGVPLGASQLGQAALGDPKAHAQIPVPWHNASELAIMCRDKNARHLRGEHLDLAARQVAKQLFSSSILLAFSATKAGEKFMENERKS